MIQLTHYDLDAHSMAHAYAYQKATGPDDLQYRWPFTHTDTQLVHGTVQSIQVTTDSACDLYQYTLLEYKNLNRPAVALHRWIEHSFERAARQRAITALLAHVDKCDQSYQYACEQRLPKLTAIDNKPLYHRNTIYVPPMATEFAFREGLGELIAIELGLLLDSTGLLGLHVVDYSWCTPHIVIALPRRLRMVFEHDTIHALRRAEVQVSVQYHDDPRTINKIFILPAAPTDYEMMYRDQAFDTTSKVVALADIPPYPYMFGMFVEHSVDLQLTSAGYPDKIVVIGDYVQLCPVVATIELIGAYACVL